MSKGDEAEPVELPFILVSKGNFTKQGSKNPYYKTSCYFKDSWTYSQITPPVSIMCPEYRKRRYL